MKNAKALPHAKFMTRFNRPNHLIPWKQAIFHNFFVFRFCRGKCGCPVSFIWSFGCLPWQKIGHYFATSMRSIPTKRTRNTDKTGLMLNKEPNGKSA